MYRLNQDNIDSEEDLSSLPVGGVSLNERFCIEDYENRKLFLTEDIDQDSISIIVRHILFFNMEDKGKEVECRKPIYLYVVSDGGEADCGFELIDVISASKTPVYTVNLGYQYSVGFLIGLAGHRRYALKNSTYLIHDGQTYVSTTTMKAKDMMDFYNELNNRIRSYVIDRTNISTSEYDSRSRQEWYIFSDEAKKLGIVDYIIGEDCNIEDIV